MMHYWLRTVAREELAQYHNDAFIPYNIKYAFVALYKYHYV